MTEESRDTETVGEVLRFAGAIAPLAPGTLVAGRFAIVRRLGSGGSSIVYEANDLKLGAPVALKILRADRATPAALKRLHREAKIAREAQDPRLVRVWDIGESAEGAFISMELVEGESLRDAIARGPLPIADAVRIGIEVLEALERLHTLGIVHRDLKPSNVLLTPGGPVKLVDFGLARHWERDESRATQADALVGTVEYLSPEQALGKPLDARTDLYSFGILLFEMLTGSLPFTSESTLGAVLAHLNERAPDVCRLRPDARPWLGRLVSRLLEKRPGDRYRSASDALADLRRGRASIAFRRRTWLAAFLVVVLAALVVSAWHLRKPRFASIGRSGNGLQAVDERGRLLWTWPDARSLAAVLRRDGEPAFVAVVDTAAKDVFLLDPATGRNVRTIGVPDPSVYFPGYARDFTAVPSAFDVDRDGRDELVLDVMHRYYPYAGVLIYPFEGTAQVVFVASGGHTAVATAKLGGDGGDALLFGGVNNRMGWYGSLAAIRIRSKDEEPDLSVVLPAATPDRDSGYTNAEDLLWYELGPQGWLNRSKAKVDYARREILIALTDGRVVKLDFDGFLKGTKSSLPRMERLAARRRAFELERASRRSMALENIDEALRANRAARSLAAAAGSPYLVEWLDRAHAIALLRKGRVAEAEVAFEALAKSGSAPGDICWDAARAFHLRGDRGRALDWYERGLASSGQVGRLKTDFVEAGIIAALEIDAFDRARSLVERGLSAHPGAGGPAYYLSFIDWRENGRAPVPPRPGNRPGDFLRATYFELRNASGAGPGELLAEMDTTGPFSELDPLWKSLRADLLRRSGRPAEAAALARAALNEARARSADDPVVRYFVPLIQERFEAARTSEGPRPAQ